MTPTLMGSAPGLVDAVMLSSCESVGSADGHPVRVRQSCSAVGAETSGGHPIFDTPLRLSEFVATLALAQDNAFGQPLESQLRSCLLATWMCEAAGFDKQVRENADWVALLRYVGC